MVQYSLSLPLLVVAVLFVNPAFSVYLEDCTAASPAANAACTTLFPDAAACKSGDAAVTVLCPFTCGNCSAFTQCSDTGVLTCDALRTAGFCETTDTQLMPMIKQHCAASCGLCDSSVSGDNGDLCSDTNSTFCQAESANCNKVALYDFMTSVCPSTCNRCNSTSTGAGCVDSEMACSVWKTNGFCGSASYTTEQKRSYCAKSCNLCS
uniref:ShKT domain-containing protein n=1 Tax=Syphacia muris TaxID=451379 RepID=A0A0N5AV22_9BILA